MNKRRMILVVAAAATMSLAACHKSCTCYSYDGSIREYTNDEVKARNTTCDKMIQQAGTRYYSYCTWQ